MKSIIVTLGVVALVGCATRETLPLTSTTSAPIGVSDEGAIKDITSARCSRADACGDIGKDRAWADMSTCNADVRRATRDYLLGQSCATGISAAPLSVCLDAVRTEACGNPHRMGERFAACDNVILCR
jgi:hypothetical protein